ncbi:hypothetical protein FDP41_005125 [Naegleria fowleri]|uniref:Uncharacterized protein n=1 Tax=Naegleria fowleri TaxID=5763 RepID=A0A6A5BNR2_NAEFO|nr:uncharacterized protein FDP41_005125 [Naegleria fowleri]KAF0975798.1 hypothetical protein FDP41_005125 [Naegleria fowleri]CAG4716665.1 unnamed protein product [Naegleria fowleri]
MKDKASSSSSNNFNHTTNVRKYHPYEKQGSNKKSQKATLQEQPPTLMKKTEHPSKTLDHSSCKGQQDHDGKKGTNKPLQQRGNSMRTNQRVMALSPDTVARCNQLRSSHEIEKASLHHQKNQQQVDHSTQPLQMLLSPSSPVFEIDAQETSSFSDISIMIMDEGFVFSGTDSPQQIMECDESMLEVFWKQPAVEPMIEWADKDYDVEWFDPIVPSFREGQGSKSTLEILLEQPLHDFMENDEANNQDAFDLFQTQPESPLMDDFH